MKNDYEFERFFIDDGNREAFEIAVGITKESRRSKNNPIWLQGPSGTGKTFLLHAIKNQLEKNGDQRSVRLISCQELVGQVLSVLKWDVYEDAPEDFIARYCREDIVMIEDVDYCLQGKEASQEEVCKIMESLIKNHGRQVILTSHELLEPFYGWLTGRCEDTRVVKIRERTEPLGGKCISHTFAPVYDGNSRILILGSFPSVKSREQQFYYGHPQNRFWKVIAGVLQVKVPETIEEKKMMLLSHGIALWDVIESCTIRGSSDSSIRDVVVNDFSEILKNSTIDKIYVNGGKAYELYEKYARKMTGIPAIKLPSTSPANAAWKLDRLIEAWRCITDEKLILQKRTGQ